MSCCPNTGANMGEPFDPECEGPQPEDVARFGEESEYAEFADDSMYGEPVGSSREGGTSSGAWKSVIVPTAGVLALVAFVLAFVL